MNGAAASERLRQRFTEAILAGRRDAAFGLALEGLGARPLLEVYDLVIAGALREVGQAWERGAISVADEHLATAVAQYVLARLYPHLPRAAGAPRGCIIVTGVEGELHQLGGNMVADVWESAGWDTRFLGTNLPTSALLRAISVHAPVAVAISATLPNRLPAVARTIDAIRERFGDRSPQVLLGGQAFHLAPDFATRAGALGPYTSLADTVVAVRSLAPLEPADPV